MAYLFKLFKIISIIILFSISYSQNLSKIQILNNDINIFSKYIKSERDTFRNSIHYLEYGVAFTSKICTVENLSDFKFCIDSYNKINYNWIIQLSSVDLIKDIYYLLNENSSYKNVRIICILFLNDMNFSYKFDFYPIFYIEQNDYNLIEDNYNIRNEKENIFIKLTFYRYIENNQKQITIILISLFTTFIFILFVFWIFLKKKYIIDENDNGYIICFTDNLLFFSLFKNFMMLYFLAKSNQTLDNYDSEDYISIIIETFNIILKSLVCHFIYTTSKGIGILQNKIQQYNFKEVIISFIVIFIFFMLDQGLSSFLRILVYYGLEVKDIKEVLFFSILILFIIFNTVKTYIIISNKIEEILLFNEEVNDTTFLMILNKKKILLIIHLIASLLYCMCFLISIFILKIVYYYYINNEIIILLTSLNIDLMIIFNGIVFRPKDINNLFNQAEIIETENIKKLEIYRVIISKHFLSDKIENEFNINLSSKIKKMKKIPFIIINPFYYSESCQKSLIYEKCSFGYISNEK